MKGYRENAPCGLCSIMKNYNNRLSLFEGGKTTAMRLIGGYQNTKTNGKDIALTPYLFGVNMNMKVIKAYGVGICWLYHSVYIAIGSNIPVEYPSWKILTPDKANELLGEGGKWVGYSTETKL